MNENGTELHYCDTESDVATAPILEPTGTALGTGIAMSKCTVIINCT